MPRNALGRGLGALIREPEAPPAPQPPEVQQKSPVSVGGGAAAIPVRDSTAHGPQEIDIDLVDPSPYQPRTRFRESRMSRSSKSRLGSRGSRSGRTRGRTEI